MIIYDKTKKMNIWFITVNGEDSVYFLAGMSGIFVGSTFSKSTWSAGLSPSPVEAPSFLCVVPCAVNNNVILCDVI